VSKYIAFGLTHQFKEMDTMNIFLKQNISDISEKEHTYIKQTNNADVALKHAKQKCALLMGKPETLITIMGIGAYKGATDANPQARRHQSLLSMGRTALLSLFH
jgi:hypothetical protein